MKRLAPFVLLVALLLIVTGLALRKHDPAVPYTDNREAWQAYEAGDLAWQAFHFDDALKKLKTAVALDPGLAPAHATLGVLYNQLGHAEPMRRHVAIAESLADGIADVRARLLLLVRLAPLEASRYHTVRDSLLDLAKTLAPDELSVLISLAQRAGNANDPATAEAIWNKILEINPNYANAHNYLGYLYLAQGRYAEAEAAMRRYAFVAPDLANPHDSLGEVLITIGRYEEAERELTECLKKQEHFPYPHLNLVHIYLARGEVSKARNLFDQLVLTLAGTTLENDFELQYLNWLFGQRLTDLHEVHAKRYLARVSDSKRSAFIRLQLRLGRGETAAAVALLDSLQEDLSAKPLFPAPPAANLQFQISLLQYRALAAEQIGLHEAAVELLQQALELGKDLPPHYMLANRVHLAYNLVPLAAYDQARYQVRETLQINPRLAEAILVAAGIEAAAGQIPEARRLLDTLERVLERSDHDFPALLDAQRLREQLPDPDHI